MINENLVAKMGLDPKEVEDVRLSIVTSVGGNTTMGALHDAIEASDCSDDIKKIMYFYLGIVTTVTSMTELPDEDEIENEQSVEGNIDTAG